MSVSWMLIVKYTICLIMNQGQRSRQRLNLGGQGVTIIFFASAHPFFALWKKEGRSSRFLVQIDTLKKAAEVVNGKTRQSQVPAQTCLADWRKVQYGSISLCHPACVHDWQDRTGSNATYANQWYFLLTRENSLVNALSLISWPHHW